MGAQVPSTRPYAETRLMKEYFNYQLITATT
jgi:hypothetical protein